MPSEDTESAGLHFICKADCRVADIAAVADGHYLGKVARVGAFGESVKIDNIGSQNRYAPADGAL